MAKLKWGGLKCADCGNNDLKFHVAFTGAEWNCEAGDNSGYGYEVMLECSECGRVYHICNCRKEGDVSAAKQGDK